MGVGRALRDRAESAEAHKARSPRQEAAERQPANRSRVCTGSGLSSACPRGLYAVTGTVAGSRGHALLRVWSGAPSTPSSRCWSPSSNTSAPRCGGPGPRLRRLEERRGQLSRSGSPVLRSVSEQRRMTLGLVPNCLLPFVRA